MIVVAVRYERDDDGVVTLVMDDPESSANTLNVAWREAMSAAVDRLYAEREDPGVTGVVVASAKSTFFAGADLAELMRVGPDDAAEMFELLEAVKLTLRRLEQLERPVVAAVNGTALGAGFEIALACHRRIVVDDRRVRLGLPEVTLGLLPGAGGTTRVVRMLGLATALTDVLLPGKQLPPSTALEKGLVDELVPSAEALVPAAKAWILAHRDDESAAANPWDRPGYRMPGGSPSSPALAASLPAYPAVLRQQTKGAVYPATRALLAAAVEGAGVDVDTALRIESRYLVSLLTGQNATNMIRSGFFDLQSIRSGSLRPDGFGTFRAERAAVLGAGMMGAGIALACARAGMDVVLKDVSEEAARRGTESAAGVLAGLVARGRLTEAARQEVLDRIRPTGDAADLAGCDLVVEAVFESPTLKQQVFAEVAAHVAPDALLCSNTSTLPITELAAGVDRPADFIGLHFFSPVDRMPLVEIIRGHQTSDEALARAYDVVQQIRKTPIVVNDARGFFTSRVIRSRVNEGLAMLAEGVHPVSLERAATMAGYPVGPLQLSDELNLSLLARILGETRDAALRDGLGWETHPAEVVIERMIELGRPSRAAGACFYEYEQSGSRTRLWPGLGQAFPVATDPIPFADIGDRLLFIEALETVRCFEEGVITSSAAANVGSLLGLGFPPMTGGVAQFVTGYIGADGSVGVEAFRRRADELAAAYGDRFRPPAYLRDLADRGVSLPA